MLICTLFLTFYSSYSLTLLLIYSPSHSASSYVTTTLVFAFKFDNAVSLKRILPTTHEEAITLIKAATVPCENMNL